MSGSAQRSPTAPCYSSCTRSRTQRTPPMQQRASGSWRLRRRRLACRSTCRETTRSPRRLSCWRRPTASPTHWLPARTSRRQGHLHTRFSTPGPTHTPTPAPTTAYHRGKTDSSSSSTRCTASLQNTRRSGSSAYPRCRQNRLGHCLRHRPELQLRLLQPSHQQ